MDTLSTESPAPRAAVRRSVGRYELLEVLGSGGMGTVYRARQEQLQKLVALKLLDPLRATKRGALTRFLREARAASQIRHPNVVQVFDVGVDEGHAFLVMELLEGHDLAAHLKLKGRLDLEEALDVLAPVIAGVRAAHEAGVVHRDLKPSNIFLARRGRNLMSPVVLDFGVSRLLGDEELGIGSVTSADALIGTAAYVAPEQAKHARLADDRSDQYALGVILYECATGERPFRGASTYELLHAIATAEVVAPSRLNAALPPAFDSLLLRALARDPEQRFADLDEFAAAMMELAAPRTWMAWGRELLADDAGAQLERMATPRTAPSLPQSRRKRGWPALAGSFLLGASASALALPTGARGRVGAEAPPPVVLVAPAPPHERELPAERLRQVAPERAAAPAPARPELASAAAMPVAVTPTARPVAARPKPPAVAAQRSVIELGSNDAPILQ